METLSSASSGGAFRGERGDLEDPEDPEDPSRSALDSAFAVAGFRHYGLGLVWMRSSVLVSAY